jgi:hypothetical protein
MSNSTRTIPFREFVTPLPGLLSLDEAEFLRVQALNASGGCIIKLGPWRARAVTSLAVGVAAHHPAKRANVYAIDPHAPAANPNGVRNGGDSRRVFYEVMVRTGCTELVTLVNLPLLQAVAGWHEPVALLFMDGDNSEMMLTAAVDSWLPFMAPGGILVFGDGSETNTAPGRVVAKLEASGLFERAGSEGKLVALRYVEQPFERRLTAEERRATSAEVEKRMLAGGYNAQTGTARIEHASYVSTRYRYVYVETPKAACTTMKHFIVNMERVPRVWRRKPYQREASRDMLIHQRRYVGLPSILDMRAEEAAAILDGTPDYFTFALVRNPYSRIASAYENKIRLGEPKYRAFGERYAAAEPGADVRAAFAGFVKNALGNLIQQKSDIHFASQQALIVPEVMKFTRIFQIEKFSEFREAFFAHLRAHDAPIPEMDSRNRSVGVDWRDYYDAETARRVAEFYAKDFELFGYDPQSWRGREDAEFRVSQSEADWRKAVIERNEMIDYLYELFGTPI